MDEIGELLEEPGEMRGLWRIPDIHILSQVSEHHYSPKFLYLDSDWHWKIDIMGNVRIGLYLCSKNCFLPKKVRYSFCILNARGEEEKRVTECSTFSGEEPVWGKDGYLEASELQSRIRDLVPLGVMTISFILKSDAQRPSEGSLFRRLWNLSLSWRNILGTYDRSDVKLNLKDGELRAHRLVLGARSVVFDHMFTVDMRESQTGKVNLKDATKDAFSVALSYAYGGIPEGLSYENVFEVYKIARRYKFEELRILCSKFMQGNLSVETFCDVLTVAALYCDPTLKECVKDYFAENKIDIFESSAWKKLKKDNPSVIIEALEWILGKVI